jgi:hypothetical protein
VAVNDPVCRKSTRPCAVYSVANDSTSISCPQVYIKNWPTKKLLVQIDPICPNRTVHGGHVKLKLFSKRINNKINGEHKNYEEVRSKVVLFN